MVFSRPRLFIAENYSLSVSSVQNKIKCWILRITKKYHHRKLYVCTACDTTLSIKDKIKCHKIIEGNTFFSRNLQDSTMVKKFTTLSSPLSWEPVRHCLLLFSSHPIMLNTLSACVLVAGTHRILRSGCILKFEVNNCSPRNVAAAEYKYHEHKVVFYLY